MYPNHFAHDAEGYQALKSLKNMSKLIADEGVKLLSSLSGEDYDNAYDDFRVWAMTELNRFGLATLRSHRLDLADTGLGFKAHKLWTLIPNYAGRLDEIMDRIGLSQVGKVTPTPTATYSDNILHLARTDVLSETKGGVLSLTGLHLAGPQQLLLGHARQYNDDDAVSNRSMITVTTTSRLRAERRRLGLPTDVERVSVAHIEGHGGMSAFMDAHTHRPYAALQAMREVIETFR